MSVHLRGRRFTAHVRRDAATMRGMTSLWQATAPRPETDAWAPGTRCDVLVVGAGITGLATADALVRRGLDVLVVEARDVGGVSTSRTTGKVSLLQGSTLSGIRRAAGPEAVRGYLEANRVGMGWWLETVGEGPALQRRDALTYAITDRGKERMLAEWEASTEAGLPVEAVGAEAMEYAVRPLAVMRLRDQLQAHPLLAMAGLVDQVRASGGRVVEGVRVTGLRAGTPHEVRTDHGPVLATHVVLATGTPVLDRGLQFGRLEPQRSYALSYRLPGGAVPQGMYLSLDPHKRSVRSVPVEGEEVLVVGGNGHPVGREPQARAQVEGLAAWSQEVFGDAEHLHTWSAQDYRSEDGIPVVGPLLGDDPTLLCASGFGKWGMANGAAAALALAGWVTGEVPAWADVYERHLPTPGRLTGLARINGMVATHLARGWAGGLASTLPEGAPAEGEGVVGRDGAQLVGCSTWDGQTRRVSAVCTHLGARLTWNDAEGSWDCPLHGSRFGADGSVLEGPATTPLARR